MPIVKNLCHTEATTSRIFIPVENSLADVSVVHIPYMKEVNEVVEIEEVVSSANFTRTKTIVSHTNKYPKWYDVPTKIVSDNNQTVLHRSNNLPEIHTNFFPKTGNQSYTLVNLLYSYIWTYPSTQEIIESTEQDFRVEYGTNTITLFNEEISMTWDTILRTKTTQVGTSYDVEVYDEVFMGEYVLSEYHYTEPFEISGVGCTQKITSTLYSNYLDCATTESREKKQSNREPKEELSTLDIQVASPMIGNNATITFDKSLLNQFVKLNVYNSSGQLIANTNFQIFSSQMNLNLGKYLNPGLHIFHMNIGNKNQKKKVIVL